MARAVGTPRVQTGLTRWAPNRTERIFSEDQTSQSYHIEIWATLASRARMTEQGASDDAAMPPVEPPEMRDWGIPNPPPLENPEPGEPPDEELRFKVGDRVECVIAEGPKWAPGTIVSHWVRAPQWPTGQFAPYLIKLDSRENLMFAPKDRDNCIRALSRTDGKEKDKQKTKIIVVCTPSGVLEEHAFKPSQFKGAFRMLVTHFAERHYVPEDACKLYCASWGEGPGGALLFKPLIKDELDVSLSLSKYIKLHGETRPVVRGREIGHVCVGLKFTKKRCEMRWPRSEEALASPTPGLADMSMREDAKPNWASLPFHILERVYRHLNNPDDLACAMLVCKRWSLDSPDQRTRAMATGLVVDKDDLDSVMDYHLDYHFNFNERSGGVTLMQFAVVLKNLDVQAVRRLLAIGVKPDELVKTYVLLCDSPEHKTIDWYKWREDQPPCEDHIAIARALIDAGLLEVDPVFPRACAYPGHRGMVAALIDTGKVSADVMNAAVGHVGLVRSEDFAMIRLLVERGANVNVATDLSKEVLNPLVNAIMHCDANMVRLLVELGADVNLKDQGETPLSLATCPGGQPMPEEADPDFWEIRDILKAAGAVL